jgi:hypothetical protein
MTDLKIVVQTPECKPPSPFLIALAARQHALALCADNEALEVPDTDVDAYEVIVAAGSDALIAAEWKLMRTPAETLLHIRMRAEVVQEMFAAADHMGRPTDNRHRLMLGALVSEIQRYTP